MGAKTGYKRFGQCSNHATQKRFLPRANWCQTLFFFFLSPVLFVRVTILVTLAVENKHGEMVLREPRRLLKRNSINRVRLKKKRSENEKNPSWHRRTITKSVVDTFPDFLKNGFLRGSSLNP